MVQQMGEDTAAGFVDSLGKGPVKQNFNDAGDRNAPRVSPYPSIDGTLLVPENEGSGTLALPVSESASGAPLVGSLVSGMPREGGSGEARIGPGDMIADYEGPETGDAEDTIDAMTFDAEYGKAVGDMVTGMPHDDYPTSSQMLTELSPQGLVTGQSKGGYAPGVNQPSSLDRGVAGPA